MRLVTLSKVIRAVLCLSAVSVTVGFLNNLHVNRSSSDNPEESPHLPAVNQKLIFGAVPSLVNHKQDNQRTLDQRYNPETIMTERLNTLNKGCRLHGLDKVGNDTLHQLNPWEYLINHKHKLVWCNVFKSGSSSWMYLFNKIAGYSDQTLKIKRVPLMSLARKKYPRPSKKELKEALSQKGVVSFIVARHPFQRLISGYRDKIVGALTGSLHHKLSRQILIKYRGVSPRALQVHSIGSRVDRRRQRYNQLQAKRSRNRSHSKELFPLPVKKLVPTFKEFVSFVLDEAREGNELDMHWTPVYSFCNPCQVNWTHLVKFETMDLDSTTLLKTAHLESYLPKTGGKLVHENPSKRDVDRSSDSYMKELTPQQLEQLTALYQPDFDIFGYDPNTIV